MKSSAERVSAHSSVRLTQFSLACILMLSGFCSLVYQTVWLREFRLVFGGAAPAAAAVMAVFMGGLGFGGKFFGSWVERVGRPFRFYARLEVGIALAAAASPCLLSLARSLYLKTGGTAGMGLAPATCLQLLITALVLGAPCFLMGGTLPAAMKFAQHDDDPRRSTTAFFYGINIAGAVCGALLSTFWLLPGLGNKATLTIAVLANLGIALAAGVISMMQEKEPRAALAEGGAGEESVAAQAPAPFVLAAAFMSGFTFFVAELVWYRVSAPLLGGSVYGFGLVLCVVLAGMGTGGLLYALMLKKAEPGIAGFTLVSALQALAILLPYALGDRIAHLALIFNDSLRGLGLGHMALGWAVVMSLLAFLPSLLSGVQFPLLVSLLGRGNAGVGRQLGRAYLWNTFGSITGSLLGGFILVPWLQLTGCWLLAALLVAAMSAASLALQLRRAPRAGDAAPATRLSWSGGVAFASLIVCGFFAFGTTGPTALWMHTPIGYGRVTHGEFSTALSLENLQRSARRTLVQAYDGRETSVAVVGGLQYSFLTNGKSDGSAVMDASTQVMLGLTGAVLHPHPQHACVVGLGTGTTAGWLADVPGMQRVDVLELEEEIRKVARYFDPVSRNAMQHPRLRNITGDAREFLLTRGQDYDLIVSEPSNPCRAGVANLYTREFYRNASQRLSPGGIFCQWLQGYEVAPDAIITVISTLRQVFAKVEVWSTQGSDMLLICANEDTPWRLDSIRQRIAQEPMAEALRRFWKTDTAEGFLASCIAGGDFCTALAATGSKINTDDMNRLEFSFARTVAREDNCSLQLARAATRAGGSLPRVEGALDMPRYYAERLHLPGRLWEAAVADVLPPEAPAEVRARVSALSSYWRHDYPAYLAAPLPATPVLSDLVLQACAKARTGAPDAPAAIAAATPLSASDACFLRAITSHHQKLPQPILDHLSQGLDALMTSPWCDIPLLTEALGLLGPLSQLQPAVKDPRFLALFDKLGRSYPVGVAQDTMLNARCEMALRLPLPQQLDAVQSYGQPYPWHGRALALRASAYLQTHDPRLDAAVADLQRYMEQGGRIGGEAPPFSVQIQKSAPTPQAQGITVGVQAGQ